MSDQIRDGVAENEPAPLDVPLSDADAELLGRYVDLQSGDFWERTQARTAFLLEQLETVDGFELEQVDVLSVSMLVAQFGDTSSTPATNGIDFMAQTVESLRPLPWSSPTNPVLDELAELGVQRWVAKTYVQGAFSIIREREESGNPIPKMNRSNR